MGLVRVSPAGGLAEVVTAEAGGVPFNFTNSVDVDQATSDVYFTNSSTRYPRARNTEIIRNRDVTGRLLRYDDSLGTVEVLMANLPYPNGVAVSTDWTHVVVAHTGPSQVHRYQIRGHMAGCYELLVELPGHLDNVRRDNRGGYWLALNRENVNTTNPRHRVGVRVNVKGEEQVVMMAPKGVMLSDITEKDDKLWLGSVELDYVGLAK
jgi:sugar lactone lactonase YvrE